jgi:hypothetical protein
MSATLQAVWQAGKHYFMHASNPACQLASRPTVLQSFLLTIRLACNLSFIPSGLLAVCLAVLISCLLVSNQDGLPVSLKAVMQARLSDSLPASRKPVLP